MDRPFVGVFIRTMQGVGSFTREAGVLLQGIGSLLCGMGAETARVDQVRVIRHPCRGSTLYSTSQRTHMTQVI